MFSLSSANYLFNFALAVSLVALAAAASSEIRSQPPETVKRLVQRAAELVGQGPDAVEVEGETTAAIRNVSTDATSEKAAAAAAEAAAGETLADADNGKEGSAPLPAADGGRMVELAALAAPYVSSAPNGAAPPLNVVAGPAEQQSAEPPGAAPAVQIESVVGGAARAPAEPVEAKLAALPSKPGVIFEDIGRKVCIGGMLCEQQCKIEAGGCEVKPAYVIKLDRPAYLSAIQLYAHDGVGPSRRAELLVKVNGEPVGAAEVHRYGSTRTIKIGRSGQLVTVESRHQHNGFLRGGEEAVIWDVYLFGREPR